MGETGRGTFIALVLVTLAALTVAFGSSVKARRIRHQTAGLKNQVKELSQAKTALEQTMHEKDAVCLEQIQGAEGVREALVQEQQKNKALTEQLQRQHLIVAQDAENKADNKVAPSQNFSSRSR